MSDRDYMRNDYGGGSGGGMQLQMPRLTPVVKLLFIINAAMFLISMIASFIVIEGKPLSYFIVQYLGLNPQKPWLFPLQILSYQFLHSVNGLGHLFGNMLGLYFFGTAVEGMLGPRRFFRLYLLSGIVGGLVYLLFALVFPGIPCIGASGAVAGVLIYFCLIRPNDLVFLFFIPIRAWILGAGYVIIGLFSLLLQFRDGIGGVAHSAHLGGALMGFLFLRGEGFVRGWLSGMAQKQAAAKARDKARDRERMDELLKKVNDHGLNSLTDKERGFLQEMSRRLK